VLALGFAGTKESAATLAISALIQPFDAVWHDHVRRWEAWHAEKVDAERCPSEFRDQFHVSAMVLRAHQDDTYPGATVASLSIPWGNNSDDVGGYHLVWPRDLVESAGALLATGALQEARDILRYLIATQLDDGRWQQNQWLGGTPRWGGIQLDEVAWPVLLASALAKRDALNGIQPHDMVYRALAYLVRQGPATDQDRWEETAGINTFTLAVSISALVCGAELLGAPHARDLLLLADDWNAHIEAWCAASGKAPGAHDGAGRYYVRAAPARVIADRAALDDILPIKNRDPDPGLAAREQISTDFLQLVRFGLRRADDATVRNTIAVVDGLLKQDTPSGPAWHRYNGDGYGEHEDGSPYNGVGKGRLWPLLTGERGHYALMAGEDARPYLRAMAAMSGRLGLIPEQVWDGEALPRYNLLAGRPSGSAMPLVWAHAEFLKLAISVRQGFPIDRPEAVWLRYAGRKPRAERAHWTRRMPVASLRQGRSLRILTDAPARIHWGLDGWRDPADLVTRPALLGLHAADVATESLAAGRVVNFTLQDVASGAWEGRDYRVAVTAPDADGA
jgi:glucoamylase